MSDAIDALGRAMHDALGINKGRTEVGVLIRDLQRRGYQIVPTTTPQFHVQPANYPAEEVTQRREAIQQRQRSVKEGPGRV